MAVAYVAEPHHKTRLMVVLHQVSFSANQRAALPRSKLPSDQDQDPSMMAWQWWMVGLPLFLLAAGPAAAVKDPKQQEQAAVKPPQGTFVGPRMDGIDLPLRVASFGSCNDQHMENPFWDDILTQKSQLWVWMGDNIYADFNPSKLLNGTHTRIPRRFFVEAPAHVLRDKYNCRPFDLVVINGWISLLRRNPGYVKLATSIPIIGIWDDHDYGINDGGNTFMYRVGSQQEFLDFLDEPKDSPRRKQEGIYTSYTVGSGDKSVKFILMDNRYHRDPYGTPHGTILGETQWKWLENELLTTKAAFNVLVSGVQILPNDRFFGAESWSKFPHERTRLLELILRSKAKGVILLSGDVHFAELNQIVCDNGRQILTEVTSSGLTHSWMEFHVRQIQLAPAMIFTLGQLLLPWEFRPRQDAFYGFMNWGKIEFDWDHLPNPMATVSIYGKDKHVKIRQEFESIAVPSKNPQREVATCQAVREVPWVTRMLWRGVTVVSLCILFLAVPVNIVIAVWLVWQLLKKTLRLRKYPRTGDGARFDKEKAI